MADFRFQPHSREEALAQELAERLGDPDGLPFYLKVTRRYSETFIRSILSRVLEYPPERIRTSRGALFNWLIRHHGERANHDGPAADPRDRSRHP
jgi:hypothetical protein